MYTRESKNFDKALASVRKRMGEFGPKGVELLLSLYEEAGRNEEALSVVSAMIVSKEKEGKDDVKLIGTKGRLLVKLGRLDEAKQYMEKADSMAPKNIQRIGDMADVYLNLKQPEKTVEKYRDLLQLSPEQPDAKFEMVEKLQ